MSQKKLDRKFWDGQKINIFLYDTQSRSFLQMAERERTKKKCLKQKYIWDAKKHMHMYIYVATYILGKTKMYNTYEKMFYYKLLRFCWLPSRNQVAFFCLMAMNQTDLFSLYFFFLFCFKTIIIQSRCRLARMFLLFSFSFNNTEFFYFQ